jgi:hypothetical protein
MKQFIKSAFFANLLIVLSFAFLTVLSYIANKDGATCPTMFFGICTIIFLIILPSCSLKN